MSFGICICVRQIRSGLSIVDKSLALTGIIHESVWKLDTDYELA